MNLKEYEYMEKFEKTYWWHQGRLNLLRVWLEKLNIGLKTRPNIFELGCGTGEVTSFLNKYGRTKSIDVSPEAVKYCKEKGLKNVFLQDVVEYDVKKEANKYDYAFALDVLEHIQDDTAAMKNTYDVLKPGGYFIVTVPAYKFLWSHHDEALHHKRRYHSLEISQKLKDTGFEIRKISHFVFFLFFPVVLIKVIGANLFGRTAYPKNSSYVAVPDKVNKLFIFLLKVEAILTKFVSLPLGTTIFVVARK